MFKQRWEDEFQIEQDRHEEMDELVKQAFSKIGRVNGVRRINSKKMRVIEIDYTPSQIVWITTLMRWTVGDRCWWNHSV